MNTPTLVVSRASTISTPAYVSISATMRNIVAMNVAAVPRAHTPRHTSAVQVNKVQGSKSQGSQSRKVIIVQVTV